jgi:Bacteriophage minor capsid protein
LDFLFRLQDYLKAKLNKPILIGVLGAESPSIAIRQTPSSVKDRYADKGKTFEFTFQVLMKDKAATGHLNVINTMNTLFLLLDGLPKGEIVSSNDSFTFVTCECYTLPNMIEKTGTDEYMYTAIFTAELEKGGS